jgi:hypothetical protein
MAESAKDAARAVLGVVVVGAPSAAQDIRDATLVKEGDLFLLADLMGNVPVGMRTASVSTITTRAF